MKPKATHADVTLIVSLICIHKNTIAKSWRGQTEMGPVEVT